MPFCSLNKELYNKNYTIVQNQFISLYMIDAPAVYTQIYLFGLYLCNSPDNAINTIEVFCNALNVTQSDIIDAYTYWEDFGLVHILQAKPIEIVYIPIEDTTNILKKISPSKYSDFNKGVEAVITSRLVTPTELNEYYIFMETTFFQPEALIMVIKYCTELKGTAINYKYILTVARNLAIGGFKTLDNVEQKLTNQPLFNEGLTEVLKALHVKREIDYEDRALFEKWTKGFGFNVEVICLIAKKIKKGGIVKLDKNLENYFKLKLFDKKEIEEYEFNKTTLYELCIDINKTLGLYYQSLDFIVEDYISPWTQQKGYNTETLILIAKYCFKHQIRTLEGMDEIVNTFYQKGLISLESIAQHFEEMLYTDKCIKAVLNQMGLLRNITNFDRVNYKTWSELWGFSQELLLYSAALSSSAKNPMTYFTKILSNFKAKNIFSVAEAEKANLSFNYASPDKTLNDQKILDDQISRQINNRKIFAEQTAQTNLNLALKDKEYNVLHFKRQSLIFDIAQNTHLKQSVTVFQTELTDIDKKIAAALKRLALTYADLEPQYFCKVCLDSGKVNNKRCQCFEELVADKLSAKKNDGSVKPTINIDTLIKNLGEIEV